MLDVVRSVFAQLCAFGVDHQPPVTETAAVQSTLHSFAHRHVFGLGVLGPKPEQLSLVLSRLGVWQVPVLDELTMIGVHGPPLAKS